MIEIHINADGTRTTVNNPDVQLPVPQAITSVQGALALRRAGLLDKIEAFIATADEDTQIFWDRASEWDRNNPVLIGLGTSLELSESQVDDLFRLAGSL